MVTKTKSDTTTELTCSAALITTQGVKQQFSRSSRSLRSWTVVNTVSNPGWKAKLGKSNATTPYSLVVNNKIKSSVPLDVTYQCLAYPKTAANPWRGTFYLRGFPVYPPSAVVALSVPSVTSEATGRLYGKIRDASQSFSGGVFIAELSDTIRMLRNPLMSVAKLTDAFIATRRKFRSTIKDTDYQAKAIAGAYLEYVFGIVPLMNDIDDILGLAADLEKDRLTTKVSSRSEKSRSSMAISTSVNVISDIQCRTSIKTTTTRRCIASAGLLPAIVGAQLSSRNLGVSLRDIPTAVYNGIPFSFLLDYFVNVGSIINAITVCEDRVVWRCQTDITETLVEYNYVGIPYSNPAVSAFPQQNIQGSLVMEQFSLDRTGSISFPSLYLDLPNFRQSLNIAALFVSLQKLIK